MNRIGLVKVSGNGFRASLFGASLKDGVGFNMGQTAYDWYERAKAAVARFESLQERAEAVPLKSERDAIIAWIGPEGSADTPMERYLTVVEDIRYVESDENMAKYEVARLQNRVVKLENYNNQLETKVRTAELTSGVQSPAPGTVTTPSRTTTTTKTTASSPWTVPLLIGGGIVAVAIVVAVVVRK